LTNVSLLTLQDYMGKFFLKDERVHRRANMNSKNPRHHIDEDIHDNEASNVRAYGKKILVQIHVVEWILTHLRVPTGRVVRNDVGVPVELTFREMAIYTNKGFTGVSKNSNSKAFQATVTPPVGVRDTKNFKTRVEAEKWAVEQNNKNYGKRFKELNLYDSYFSTKIKG